MNYLIYDLQNKSQKKEKKTQDIALSDKYKMD